MPILGKTTNIKASDLNALRGVSSNQQVSIGALTQTWFGTSNNTSFANSFGDNFTGTQTSNSVIPGELSDVDPLDWYHRGSYCGGEAVSISGDGTRMAIAKTSFGVYIYLWSGSVWTYEATVKIAGLADGTGPEAYASVALNYDGSTLAAGQAYYMKPATTEYPGAAYVWTRSGTTWTQQAGPLVPSGYSVGIYGLTPQAGFLDTLRLSNDGNTLIIGGKYDNGTRNPATTGTSEGAIYVFFRTGTSWAQQARLTSAARYGAIVASYDQLLGTSVGLSSDGNTIVAGGPRDNASSGAVVVFFRTGTSWAQQLRLQNTSDINYQAYLGNTVALTADGNTFAASYTNYNAFSGNTAIHVLVYTRSGTTWTLQQNISGISSSPQPYLTFTDANTLVVGGRVVYTRSGSTWSLSQTLTNEKNSYGFSWGSQEGTNIIMTTGATTSSAGTVHYKRTASTWAQQGSVTYIKPIPNSSGVTTLQEFATRSIGFLSYNQFMAGDISYRSNGAIYPVTSAVGTPIIVSNYYHTGEAKVSGDGNIVALGHYNVANTAGGTNVGAVTIWANTSGTWANTAYIQPQDTNAQASFGKSLALNADATTLIVGAPGNSSWRPTATYIYTRSGLTWTLQQKIPDPLTNWGGFGESVAISGDGNTAVIGSAPEGGNIGGARVYTRSGSTWTLQQTITATRKGSGSSTLLFGTSLALSGDGNTMAISAPYDTLSGATTPITGTVNIYTRTAGVWTLKASLQPSTTAYMGSKIALSGDGYTLAASVPYYNSSKGGALVYSRQNAAGDTWTLKSNLSPSDSVSGQYVGGISGSGSLTLHPTGNKILLSGYTGKPGFWSFE